MIIWLLAETVFPKPFGMKTLCRPCAGGGGVFTLCGGRGCLPCAGHLVPQCGRTISVKFTDTDSTWEVSPNGDKSTKTAPMKTKRPSQTQILRERRQQTVTNQREDEGGWAHPIMGPVGAPSPPTPPQTTTIAPPPQNNIPANATNESWICELATAITINDVACHAKQIIDLGPRQGQQNQRFVLPCQPNQ